MSSSSILSTSQKRLLRIVMRNDKSQLEEFLKQPLDLGPQELGNILWHAVRLGVLEIASMLVMAGANVDYTNPFDDSRSNLLHHLMTSMDSKYYEQFARILIEHGANINACNKYNQTVLHRAIIKSKPVEVIDKLFEFGAHVKNSGYNNSFKLNADPSAPLLLDTDLGNNKARGIRAGEALTCCILNVASDKQLLFYAEMFLNKKLPAKDLENDGLTLYYAIRRGQLVQLLVDYGLDVNRAAKNVEVWKFDINSQKYDVLPVCAASSLPTSNTLELLIRAGANINACVRDPEKHKGYAIHAACEKTSVENIEVLLRHGVDISVTDFRGKTPLTILDDNNYRGEAYQNIIRHLAVLASKGKNIKRCDIDVIQKSDVMLKYYTKCTKELETMKSFKIINNVSMWSIFQEDLTELLFTNRNGNFIDDSRLVIWKCQLSIFYKEIVLAFEEAKRLKKSLNDVEKSLHDALGNTLPYIPLEKVLYYLCLDVVK